jgi:hypothetical protein
MKYFLLLLSVFTLTTVTAQENKIVIKVQKQTLTVDANEDGEKTVILNSASKSAKTDKFVIFNSNKAEAKTWKRSFTIYDDADAEIVKFPKLSATSYSQLSLSTVLSKLKKGTDYSLYTIAVPADPKRAAVVRVRRVLVCKIEVK